MGSKNKYITVATVLIGLCVSLGMLFYLNLKSKREGLDNKVVGISSTNIAGNRQEDVQSDVLEFSDDAMHYKQRALFDIESQRMRSRQLREKRGTIVKNAVRQTPRTRYEEMNKYSSMDSN
jgi:hypothetical protein